MKIVQRSKSVKYAERVAVDLILAGTRGKHGLSDMYSEVLHQEY